jgi:hypothetical protein
VKRLVGEHCLVEDLERIRRHRRWSIGLFPGWLPFGGILIVLARVLDISSEAVNMMPALAYMLTWGVFQSLHRMSRDCRLPLKGVVT